MGTIDFDKFLASFITAMKECNRMRTFSISVCIKKALEEQGLEYKDGEIVKSQRRVSAEAKENGYGESKDERIRKEIIAILQYKYENFSKDPKYCNAPQWIAWLEKQGEHANFRNKIQIGDKVTRNKDGVLVNLSQLNRVAKKDEKQGEQKPAWTEADDEELEIVINALKGAGKHGSFDWLSTVKWLLTIKQRIGG